MFAQRHIWGMIINSYISLLTFENILNDHWICPLKHTLIACWQISLYDQMHLIIRRAVVTQAVCLKTSLANVEVSKNNTLSKLRVVKKYLCRPSPFLCLGWVVSWQLQMVVVVFFEIKSNSIPVPMPDYVLHVVNLSWQSQKDSCGSACLVCPVGLLIADSQPYCSTAVCIHLASVWLILQN